MKVTMRNYQPAVSIGQRKQQMPLPAKDNENGIESMTQTDLGGMSNIDPEQTGLNWNPMDDEAQDSSLSALLEQAKESSNFKVSTSMPDDSVGELATELARSESKMDVVQVSSKAMRALANLKMSYVLSEGKDKEKIAQMIRRMERLTKKIHKKMRNLTNEEQMELQRKRAEKRQEIEREAEIRNELRRKKTKRRREEQNYASKEVDADRKEALQDTISAMTASLGGSASSVELAAAAAGISNVAPSSAVTAAGVDAYVAAMDAPVMAMDSGAVDVVV